MLPDPWSKLGDISRLQKPLHVFVHAHNPRPALSTTHFGFAQSLKTLEKFVSRSHSDLGSALCSMSFNEKQAHCRPFNPSEDFKEGPKGFQKAIKGKKRAVQPIAIVKGLSKIESILPHKMHSGEQSSELFIRIAQIPGIRPSPLARDKLQYTLDVPEAKSKKPQYESRLGPIYLSSVLEPRPRRQSRIVVRKDKVYGPCECATAQFRLKNLHYRLHGSSEGREVTKLKPLFIENRDGGSKLAIAIVFDGVLGDVYKRCLTDTSPKEIRIRKRAVVGLHWLQQCFRLVFISLLSRKKSLRVLNHFREAQIVFEAAYVTTGEQCAVLDYENITADLKMSAHRLLVVTSIDLPYEDLMDGEEVLYVRSGSKLKLTAMALPAPNSLPPLVLLIPSIRAQSPSAILPFDKIASYIYRLKGRGDWRSSFALLRSYPTTDLIPISTEIVFEAFLDVTLPYPKADNMRKGKDRCPKHDSLIFPPADPRPASQLILLKAHTSVGGTDTLEMNALTLPSGFLNLLSYTSTDSLC